NVKVGDTVRQGDVIAWSGTTGNSTGPHLHFGIKENDTWVDPLNYLTGWHYYG
ncbi:MAG: M23 family metallopeptidase, partial [Oscillospiraceae bacterium]|nr:M23 family metallopeptidase [Oscillospiraceae bacterium]